MSPDVSFAELNGAYWIDSDPSLHGTEECAQCTLLHAAGGGETPSLREDAAADRACCGGIGWVLTTGRPLLVTCAAITVTAALVTVALG
ncbi:hypothetical protein OG311_35275 [Streptomyces sp. NBC_01343]|uniref:hypothetical protein n=1 Tax=Streptomyces sp. NBC_01343 TaxID=2903832 RepID=UPI002E132C0B|nr:hypothetical protein OG311_35275 [Streptomyces sp. NBC_01343]